MNASILLLLLSCLLFQASSHLPLHPSTRLSPSTPNNFLDALAIKEEQLTDAAQLTLDCNFKSLRVTMAGEPLEMRCDVYSVPSVNIYWTLNGEIIQGSRRRNVLEKVKNIGKKVIASSTTTSMLDLDCVDQSYEGVVSIVADNGHMKKEVSHKLSIQGNAQCPRGVVPSPPSIHTWTVTRLENLLNAATLLCRSDSPNVKTIWSNEENPNFASDNNYQVLSNGDLFIKKMGWDDIGTFKCTVQNKMGSSSVEAFLYPTAPQEFGDGVSITKEEFDKWAAEDEKNNQ